MIHPDAWENETDSMGVPAESTRVYRVDAYGFPLPSNVTAGGKSMPPRAWSRRTGVNEGTIKTRLRYGWDPERAVSEPAKVKGAA